MNNFIKVKIKCIFIVGLLILILPINSIAQQCGTNIISYGTFESGDVSSWGLSIDFDNLSKSSTYSYHGLYSLKMDQRGRFETSSFNFILGRKYRIKAKFYVPQSSTFNSTHDYASTSLELLRRTTFPHYMRIPEQQYFIKNGIRGQWVDLISRFQSKDVFYGALFIALESQPDQFGESFLDNLELIEICPVSYTTEIVNVSQTGGEDGSVKIILSGGEEAHTFDEITYPDYSFKTMWPYSSAGINGNIINITGLKAGQYTIRVGDLNTATRSDDDFYYQVSNGYAHEIIFNINEPSCSLPIINDLIFENYLCTIKFDPEITNPQNCTLAYNWNFGDGSTSNQSAPFHSYTNTGTYNVNLSVDYNCPCQTGTINFQKAFLKDGAEDIFQQQQIQIPSEEKKQVLSSSVTTFSDAWALHHNKPELADKESYTNGTMGIWRGDATYVYEKERKQTTSPDLKADGTYTLQQFNWEYADLEAVPDWIKLNTMTEYSPFSFELENRDVLGRYSAALYDYGGQLQSTNGSNMKYQEMAFTSFESEEDRISGNWKLGDHPKPKTKRFKINSGFKNIVLVEGKLNEFDGIEEVEVLGRSLGKFIYRNIKTKIVCLQVFKDNPDWTYLVLEREIIPYSFIGTVTVRNPLQPTNSVILDSLFAHSGKRSLKITADGTFKQELLALGSGKAYLISAWVSVKDFHLSTPQLADDIGIDIIFKNKEGVVQSVTFFEPSGSIIEGWQQLKGTFTAPDSDHTLELKFKPGSKGTAWYDDLRLHPEEGNMQSYVYDVKNFRLQAILDEENFASFYYYDQEGNLHLVKKETEQGIKTISESVSYKIEKEN